MYLPSLISSDYTKKERRGLPTVPPLLRPWLNSLVELVALALVIVRVENPLGDVGAGLLEEVLVKGLNLGVEMALNILETKKAAPQGPAFLNLSVKRMAHAYQSFHNYLRLSLMPIHACCFFLHLGNFIKPSTV